MYIPKLGILVSTFTYSGSIHEFYSIDWFSPQDSGSPDTPDIMIPDTINYHN